ncbi:MAG: ATP-binding protein [bacterium]|nr:ATP-binding protein [bacterium]
MKNNILQTIASLFEHIETNTYRDQTFDFKSVIAEKKPEIDFVKKFFKNSLKLNDDMDVLVLALIISISLESNEFGINEISRTLNLKKTVLYLGNFHLILNDFLSRGILKQDEGRRRKRAEYCLNENIMSAVLSNLKSKKKIESDLCDTISVLILAKEMCKKYDSRNDNFDDSFAPILRKFEKCEDLFLTFLKTFTLEPIEIQILLFCAFGHVDGMSHGFRVMEMMEDFFPNDFRMTFEIKKKFMAGIHPLVEMELVQLTSSGQGFNDDVYIELTPKVKEKLFEDQGIGTTNIKQIKELKYYKLDELEPLFFPEKLQKELDRFCEMIKRADEIDFPALLAIFRGLAGTGKSEVVKHIAAKVGRGVFRVNISDFRNSFYGESEKQTMKIFEKVNKMYADGHKPIFLIEEIDGILQKRAIENTSSTGNTDYRLQNIILNALSSDLPKGCVLIGTTNYGEMSPEYHRRFPVQIDFQIGDYECRFKHWHHLLGDDPNIKKYAEYELTAAIVQNIVYQMNTDKLLFVKVVNSERVLELIEKEVEASSFGNKKRLGFKKN